MKSHSKKEIEISLRPNKNKQFDVNMMIDQETVKTAEIDSSEMKEYLIEKSPLDIDRLRETIKMFKSSKIKLEIK